MTTYNHFFPIIHHVQVPELGAQIEGNVGTRERYLVPGRGYQTPVSARLWEENRDKYIEDARVLANYHRTIGLRHVKEAWELWPGLWSSPPHHDRLLDYAEWICEVIALLGPNAIELSNEPNVGRFLAAVFHKYFGAWIWDETGRGDASAGGVLYRKMLEVVYPYVKSRYPNVEIVAGALMANEHTEEFLRAFKDGPTDSISFHLYLGIDETFEKLWDYIQRLRRITPLPLVMSETAIVATMDSPRLRERQAEYLEWIVKNWQQLGLRRAIWYTLGDNGGDGAGDDGSDLGGWMCSDMARRGVPYPVYHIFRDVRI